VTGPMNVLRIVGCVVAALLLYLAVRRFRRRGLRLTDTVIMTVLALSLGTVSIAPSLVDPVLRVLGFPPGNARRVIGLLVLSNILTYVLLLRAFAKTDRLEQTLGEYADRVAARNFQGEYAPGGHREPTDALATTGMKKLAVVIPAFNEEDSLPAVLKDVADDVEGLKVEAIVISDGSSDATERVAEEFGALVVRRDLRRGQGAAVRLGYRMALVRGADIVATVDADGQYDPLELPQLIRPIIDGEADVSHGSRSLGAYERPLFGRSQGIKVFAWLTSRLTRSKITDPASGFRAFSAEALRVLQFRENQFHASEVTLAAAKAGFRVKEVPCTFRERFAGTTKKPPLLKYGLGYARSLIRTWLH
jgi:GT2 family glycosyltransferase